MEICRKHTITRQKLEIYMASKGVPYGDLAAQVRNQVRLRTSAALLSDEDIVSQYADRSVAIIKSHLTLTRALHARLSELLDGYDKVVTKITTVSEDGEDQVDPKTWIAAANILDGVTKVAERITRMELSTFAVSNDRITVLQDKPDEEPGMITIDMDDPLKASAEYARIMKG